MVIRLQQNNKMEVTKVLHYTSSSDVTSLFSKGDSSSLTFENGIKRAHPSTCLPFPTSYKIGWEKGQNHRSGNSKNQEGNVLKGPRGVIFP